MPALVPVPVKDYRLCIVYIVRHDPKKIKINHLRKIRNDDITI